MTVVAITDRTTNAEVIAAAAQLGYLDGEVLDITYGLGRFWTCWQPEWFLGVDLNPTKTDPVIGPVDATEMPFPDQWADAVVFDPPYRLNGTPDQSYDAAYGITETASWQERCQLIIDGTAEACRVARTHVLVKCQAQVCSGKVRWQDDMVTAAARDAGFGKVDRFDLVTRAREQPKGRRQVHARRNHSTLLVFRRGWF